MQAVFSQKVGGLIKPPTTIDKKDAEGVTTALAAKQLSVSRDTVKRAKVVADKAVPDIVEAVKRGEVTIADAPRGTLPEGLHRHRLHDHRSHTRPPSSR